MPQPFTYDLASEDPSVRSRSQVRLLLNDVDATTRVFEDAEVDAFLAMEGGAVKLAAAQAIDVNATDQALASKVLRTQDLTTDGAKLADAMRKHATNLRAQHAAALEDADEGYFAIVPPGRSRRPELTGGLFLGDCW